MRIRAWPVLARYGARLEPGKRIKLTSLQLSLANKFKNSDFYSMNFPSFQETIYQADGPQRVLLVSPHGADSQEFLAAFPAIQEHPQMQAIWPLFETYLAIERDTGADELTHAIAQNLKQQHAISSLVFQIKYPRAIIDGGRLPGHCLRACFPTKLALSLRQAFLDLHERTLKRLEEHYAAFDQQRLDYLIDVHTMASFCPVDSQGQRFLFPISFPLMDDYVRHFLEARNHEFRRSLDLITADDNGRCLAEPKLLKNFHKALAAGGYPFLENIPYCASAAFLSQQHLLRVPSISFDVPKHFLASWADNLSDYQLDDISLDKIKIERLAAYLAQAIAHSLVKSTS